MRTWLKDPLAILADDCERGVVVEGTTIAERVGRGREPAIPVDQVFDASAHVIIPGLINGHHHFFQTLTRAHPAAINKPLFPWLMALFPIWRALNPEALRLATRLAFVELMMSGCTCASDHHYAFPKGLEDAIDIQADEARRLGMRATLTRGSMSLSAKDGGLPPEYLVQDQDVILADSERLLSRHHDRKPGAMIQIALAPCAPFAVSKTLMRESMQLAERFDCSLHTHLAETEDENRYCLDVFGMRPVDYLEDVGWMNSRVWVAHGVHFNDAEIGRLGRHGVGVCHCPTSNMGLASGQARPKDLEQAGCPVGLGVDGSASNDNSNLMESVRHALLLNRLRYGADGMTHLDALRWATQGTARCLGRTDIGEIAPGKEADLALFKLDELRFSGAHDPLAALVLCGAHRADRVMIAGDWRVVDGLPLGLDLAELRADHHAIARRLFA